MKHLFLCMATASALTFAGFAMAVDMPADGKSKCGACHAIDHKLVGPSFMDISKKYQGDKDEVNKIAANITKGGEFGWKMNKMPPKGLGATDAQIKSLSQFIAGLTK